MAKIKEIDNDEGGKYIVAYLDEDRQPIDESEATNVYITEIDGEGNTTSTRWGTVKPNNESQDMSNIDDEETTNNVENLVTNAISVHNDDPWYMDLLEAALDESPIVNDAIRVANRAYKDNPIRPTRSEDITDNEEDDSIDVVYNEDEEDDILQNAIEEASNTQFEEDDDE